MKTPADNAEEKTEEDTILKQLSKNAYNGLISAQDDTVCFQIVEKLLLKSYPTEALYAHG